MDDCRTAGISIRLPPSGKEVITMPDSDKRAIQKHFDDMTQVMTKIHKKIIKDSAESVKQLEDAIKKHDKFHAELEKKLSKKK